MTLYDRYIYMSSGIPCFRYWYWWHRWRLAWPRLALTKETMGTWGTVHNRALATNEAVKSYDGHWLGFELIWFGIGEPCKTMELQIGISSRHAARTSLNQDIIRSSAVLRHCRHHFFLEPLYLPCLFADLSKYCRCAARYWSAFSMLERLSGDGDWTRI